MIKIKDGFNGEIMVSLPDSIIKKHKEDPLINNLYIKKIGFYPYAKYHYVENKQGNDYAILIYCKHGKGKYHINNQKYIIKKEQYIIIPPRTAYALEADEEHPWSIFFVHFDGTLSYKFIPSSHEPSLISNNHYLNPNRLQLFEEIINSFSKGYIKEYMIYSSMILYSFLTSFVYLNQLEDNSDNEVNLLSFSSKIINFMRENIQDTITIKELSKQFKYSPSYISALFTKETGTPPIKFFLHLKIHKACEMLEKTDLKLTQISKYLGFEDVAYFSRLFKKITGKSPSVYKDQKRV